MKMNTKFGKRIRFLTQSALIAALYVGLTYLAYAFGLDKGVIQVRFSEALCVLAALTPTAVPGVTLGCFLAGLLTAAHPLDIVVGTLASFFGVFGCRMLRRLVSGKLSFADTVIEARAEAAHRGKKPLIVECKMTVQKSSFADGMEVREILWPPTCTVLSIDKNPVHAAHGDLHCLEAGDVLHLHYRTYDPDLTVKNLVSILGEQSKDLSESVELGSEEHLVPED